MRGLLKRGRSKIFSGDFTFFTLTNLLVLFYPFSGEIIKSKTGKCRKIADNNQDTIPITKQRPMIKKQLTTKHEIRRGVVVEEELL
jgi:hypothetical protein